MRRLNLAPSDGGAIVYRAATRGLGTLFALALIVSSLACGGGGGNETARPASGGFGGSISKGATGVDPIVGVVAANFGVLLVVSKEDSQTVDRVFLVCGSSGTIEQTVGVAENIAIDDAGKFTLESKDVAMSGTFTSRTKATGTIRARTDGARSCGVPANATWQAPCAYRMKRIPLKKREPELPFGLSVITGNGGRKIAFLEVDSTTKERGFSLRPGTCGTSTR